MTALRAWLRGLSPRRRALFAVLAAAVAIGVVVVAGTVLSSALRGTRDRPPAQDKPGPVVLVPGYGGGTTAVEVLAAAVRATGRAATVLRLPADGTGDLNQQADALDDEVARVVGNGAPSVDIVGYSAGGVVARLWAQRASGPFLARRIITLGSPHHGTTIAAAGAALLPGACPAACQQLVPGSRLLAGLAGPVPVPPRWLSVWTEQDQTVTPPDSARLDGAVNVAIQTLCPRRQVSHSQLPTDAAVTAVVLAAIGAGPIALPGSAVCGPR